MIPYNHNPRGNDGKEEEAENIIRKLHNIQENRTAAKRRNKKRPSNRSCFSDAQRRRTATAKQSHANTLTKAAAKLIQREYSCRLYCDKSCKEKSTETAKSPHNEKEIDIFVCYC